MRRSGSRPSVDEVRSVPQGDVINEGAQMIEVRNLSKRYGDKLAVDGLDFVVQPGAVTGFLGPNGAGKSPPMRLIAGPDEPGAGSLRGNRSLYPEAAAPIAGLRPPLEA